MSNVEQVHMLQLSTSLKIVVMTLTIVLMLLGTIVKRIIYKLITTKGASGVFDRLILFEQLMSCSCYFIGFGILASLLGYKGEDFGIAGYCVCSIIDLAFLFNAFLTVLAGASIATLRLLFIWQGIQSKSKLMFLAKLLPWFLFSVSALSGGLLHTFPAYEYNYYMDLCLGHEERYLRSESRIFTALILRGIFPVLGIVCSFVELGSYVVIFMHILNHERFVAQPLFGKTSRVVKNRRHSNIVSLQGHFATHILELTFLLLIVIAGTAVKTHRTQILEISQLMFPIFSFLLIPVIQVVSSRQMMQKITSKLKDAKTVWLRK
ncbi:uncharacterized protein LOC131879666 [Tigriopus californicus]|uniref:uncharacterized protein LOC131879666 n=1 Tax=Tigriopus californicus TaxID=6832 RepID=UPI0027DA771B|nr:uncharacterized protein LOC131879666 [Tigriopus californicus]